MKQQIKESNQNQPALAGQNDTAQLRAENQSVSGVEAAPYSTQDNVSDNQKSTMYKWKVGEVAGGVTGDPEKAKRLAAFFAS